MAPVELLSTKKLNDRNIKEREDSDMSVIVIATAFPIPDHRDEVIAAFEAAIKRVHNESGVELYALNEGVDRVVIIEKYVSDQARVAHNQGAALADLAAALHGKLSRELDVQVLQPHPVGDAGKGAV
jgi:quinol monooxygenase YgiN